MNINTFTSREFNQNPNKAKKASKDSIVFITERGTISHVLLSVDAYHKLQKINIPQTNIVDMLSMQNDQDIEFEPTKLGQDLFKKDIF
ncbi:MULTISPECIES: type II toxin-antitoxin system Phd/YefM family antitoxin [Cysteiniphilum]|uniref:Antitoxin n=1 Tax=Cysteiniphilum litorale TaxID=2056700 RepID=A0A8J2Z5K2_9GAMM|nr:MULTISPECIES: type II toxin-antitoxin system Phd/YefM family antitoxin [Cysteiniphilum]GGG01403.1 antitoxin [Cysteiniphilum litorale]